VEAITPFDSLADVILQIYAACGSVQRPPDDPGFSPDIRVQFTAPTSGAYHLYLGNNNNRIGPQATYRLSVRALSRDPQPGALILVAGRLRYPDSLQQNIYYVTNTVYRLFLAHSYTAERIYYLAPEAVDANDPPDGLSDVDELVSRDSLERAITQWALDKVGPERALTLYLMDHGARDLFYLNFQTQTVSPSDLDQWLTRLEQQIPGLKVNVILDACFSGSFINGAQRLSRPGRVIVTSTDADTRSFASSRGEIFGDAFLEALGRGMSLYTSFDEARGIVRRLRPAQSPWLDDNGDGRADATDGVEAQQRGFAFAGTFENYEQYPPYIRWATIGPLAHETAEIQAQVQDDGGVAGVVSVWAVVYKPSYAPPSQTGSDLIWESLPTVQLQAVPGQAGRYSALYDRFTEMGVYRLVVQAVDTQGLQSRPVEVLIRTNWPVFLPLIVRGVSALSTAGEGSREP